MSSTYFFLPLLSQVRRPSDLNSVCWSDDILYIMNNYQDESIIDEYLDCYLSHYLSSKTHASFVAQTLTEIMILRSGIKDHYVQYVPQIVSNDTVSESSCYFVPTKHDQFVR